MDIEAIGEVIAERTLCLSAQNAADQDVVVRIGKPQRFSDEPDDYYVPYEIVGSEGTKLFYAAGVDAIQALQLVMRMIGADLLALCRDRNCTIKWIGGEDGDLGFPIAGEAAE